MSKILITGGTGLIGNKISQDLLDAGHSVVHLSRNPANDSNIQQFQWDVNRSQLDIEALREVDHIIHLAGAGVADHRWSQKRKQEILDSRVKGTELLYKAVIDSNLQLQSFISASAIGYYGYHGSKTFRENDPPGKDFLAKVTADWEQAADLFSTKTRVAKIRIGVVLDAKAGAFPKILKPITYGVGAPVGSGSQWMSWIHIEDLSRIFQYVLGNELAGTYNAVAPNPVSNRRFTQDIATEVRRPLWLPNVPSVVMQIAFGEMSEIILKGSKVSSEALEKAGFKFKYPYSAGAIKDLLNT